MLLITTASLDVCFLGAPATRRVHHATAPVLTTSPSVLPRASTPSMRITGMRPTHTVHPVITRTGGVTRERKARPSMPIRTIHRVTSKGRTIRRVIGRGRRVRGGRPMMTGRRSPIMGSRGESKRSGLRVPMRGPRSGGKH